MRRPLVVILLGATLVTAAACSFFRPASKCGADVIAACTPNPPTDTPSPVWPGGRTFTASSIIDDGAPKELVPGTELTVTFREPYELSIYAGCKTIDVKARLDGERLVPEMFGVTPLLCLDARDAQDTWIQEFFQDRPLWTFDGPNVMLIAGDTKIYLETQS